METVERFGSLFVVSNDAGDKWGYFMDKNADGVSFLNRCPNDHPDINDLPSGALVWDGQEWIASEKSLPEEPKEPEGDEGDG